MSEFLRNLLNNPPQDVVRDVMRETRNESYAEMQGICSSLGFDEIVGEILCAGTVAHIRKYGANAPLIEVNFFEKLKSRLGEKNYEKFLVLANLVVDNNPI